MTDPRDFKIDLTRHIESFGSEHSLGNKPYPSSFIEPRRTDTPELHLGKKLYEYLIIRKSETFANDDVSEDLLIPAELPLTRCFSAKNLVTRTETSPRLIWSMHQLHIKPLHDFEHSNSPLDQNQGIDVARTDDQFLGCSSASDILSDFTECKDRNDETSVPTNGNDKEKPLYPVVDEGLVLDEQTELQLKLISVGVFSKIYQYKHNKTKGALKVATGNGSTEMRVNWDIVGTLQDSPGSRLDREVEILKCLQHPNIIRLMAAGNTSDGRQFIITEMLPKWGMISPKPMLCTIPVWRKLFRRKAGRSDTIKRKLARMKPRDVAVKGVQLAQALGYLHTKALDGKIVHGNICPDNIGIGEDGELKVMDFSSCFVTPISGEVGQDDLWNETDDSLIFQEILTRSQRLPFSCGALRYMAPEVTNGNAPISPASDVYSLGLLLWSLVSGMDPYEGTTRSSFYSSVVHYGERPSCSIPWPEPLRDIVCLCWSQNPESRPSASTVEVALTKFVLKRKL